MIHHHPPVPHPPGITRPHRHTTPKVQRRIEAQCAADLGHCWHSPSPVAHWCCACSAAHDGLRPPQRCRQCTTAMSGATS